MAGVARAGLDLGAGDPPVSPLADEPRRQEVAVQAQLEPQGLSFVTQLVEGEELAPGGRRPPAKGSVGQVVGEERSALVDLDGMDHVAAGVRRGRLWGESGSAVSSRVHHLPAPTPSNS